jgi:polyketide cyclase/dehydrase/lipid transport protein
VISKVLIGIAAILVIFLGYVSTREGKFNYERSGVINAAAEKIFPYLSDFSKGGEWSPYEKVDPQMKKNITGTAAQVGHAMDFDSKEAGSGRLEILKIVPSEMVEIKLTMTKPLHAENIVTYKLTPDIGGTRFSWAMAGDGGFMTKLMTVFIDCEKMIAGQFEEGIQNLKALIEAQK